MESCDVYLEEGYGTCDEEGVDGGYLVVERVFHAFWGVEYEDGWRGISLSGVGHRVCDLLKQNAVM